MSLADWLRLVAAMMAAICAFGFIVVITSHAVREARRVWLLVASVELYLVSCVVQGTVRFGDPEFKWYGLPVALAAGVLGVVYLVIYRRDARRGQRLARQLQDK
jgi:hypothetical protein